MTVPSISLVLHHRCATLRYTNICWDLTWSKYSPKYKVWTIRCHNCEHSGGKTCPAGYMSQIGNDLVFFLLIHRYRNYHFLSGEAIRSLFPFFERKTQKLIVQIKPPKCKTFQKFSGRYTWRLASAFNSRHCNEWRYFALQRCYHQSCFGEFLAVICLNCRLGKCKKRKAGAAFAARCKRRVYSRLIFDQLPEIWRQILYIKTEFWFSYSFWDSPLFLLSVTRLCRLKYNWKLFPHWLLQRAGQ